MLKSCYGGYMNNLIQNKLSSIKVVRPVHKQAPVTGTQSTVYYDYDYYIPSLYFPSISFCGLLRLLMYILIIIFCVQGVFLAMLVFFRLIRARTYTCPKCNRTFKINGKTAPEACEYCGADLNPPKCP